MNNKQVTARIVEAALNLLEYDDAFPSVGIGMLPQTAVKEAADLVEGEALSWGFDIDISDEMRDNALTVVKQKRTKKWS